MLFAHTVTGYTTHTRHQKAFSSPVRCHLNVASYKREDHFGCAYTLGNLTLKIWRVFAQNFFSSSLSFELTHTLKKFIAFPKDFIPWRGIIVSIEIASESSNDDDGVVQVRQWSFFFPSESSSRTCISTSSNTASTGKSGNSRPNFNRVIILHATTI